MISLTARGLIVLRLRKPLVVNVLCGGFQAHTKWPQINCTQEHHHHHRLPLLPQTQPRPLFPMMSVFWSRKQIEHAQPKTRLSLRCSRLWPQLNRPHSLWRSVEIREPPPSSLSKYCVTELQGARPLTKCGLWRMITQGFTLITFITFGQTQFTIAPAAMSANFHVHVL